jgi:hypothetical protein
MVRYGTVPSRIYGTVRYGTEDSVTVWYGTTIRFVVQQSSRNDTVHGTVRYMTIRYDRAWYRYGMSWHGIAMLAWHGIAMLAWHCTV